MVTQAQAPIAPTAPTQPAAPVNGQIQPPKTTSVTPPAAPTQAETATAARANAQAELQRTQAPFQQRLAAALEKFVQVTKCPDHYNFKYVGQCLKCGWNTHQMTDADARKILRDHVQCHWRDVSAGL